MIAKVVKNSPASYVWGVKGASKVGNQYDGYGKKNTPKKGKKK